MNFPSKWLVESTKLKIYKQMDRKNEIEKQKFEEENKLIAISIKRAVFRDHLKIFKTVDRSVFTGVSYRSLNLVNFV